MSCILAKLMMNTYTPQEVLITFSCLHLNPMLPLLSDVVLG